MKKTITLSFLLLIFFLSFSQQFKDNSLGRLKKLSKGTNTYTIETTNGSARISIYNPEIIRIWITREGFQSDFSYSVVGTPQVCIVKFVEAEGMMMIQTDSLRLEISTDPVRFTLKDIRGNLLNQDDPAFGTSWVGDEVTTYKKIQEGEKFVGLGEKTGNLDRRGEGYVNWNSDVPGYPVNQDPLYASFPFYIGIHCKVAYVIYFSIHIKAILILALRMTGFPVSGQMPAI